MGEFVLKMGYRLKRDMGYGFLSSHKDPVISEF